MPLVQQINSLSRKQEGSNACRIVYETTFLRKTRLHEKNQEKEDADWFFKLALRLVRKYDRIAIETLNLEAFMKKLWGRKVSDLHSVSFHQYFKGHVHKYGKTLLKSERWSCSV